MSDAEISDLAAARVRRRGTVLTLIAGVALVGCVVAAVHWPELAGKAFVKDDREYMRDNPLVRNPSWASAKRFLGIPPYQDEILQPSTVSGYYQPLAMISLMLDFARDGDMDNFRPYRETSLALHVLNSMLVVLLLYALFGKPIPAALAGLLFGLHPSTVESVAWLSDRKTLLATFFALWSLILYVRCARGGRWLWHIGVGLFYVLALMSKPTTVPLPVLMLLLDFWPFRRLRWRAVFEKLPLFAIMLLAAYVTYMSQKNSAAVIIAQPNTSPWRPPLILLHNLVFYPLRFLLPLGMTTHYDFPRPMDLSHPRVLIGVVGSALIVTGAAVSLRWTRVFATGWLFHTVAIAPALNVVGFTDTIAADRFNYLPSIGFLLIVTWAACRLWGDGARAPRAAARRGAVVAGMLVWVAVLTVATRSYAQVWLDTERIHRRMVALAPQSPEAHYSYAVLMYETGRVDAAIAEYRRAIQLRPDYFKAHLMLGNAYRDRGETELAVRSFEQALRYAPGYPKAAINLGAIRMDRGEFREALNLFLQVERHYPDQWEAYVNAGLALAQMGRLEEALPHLQRAVEIAPHDYRTHQNLAYTMTKLGRDDEAVRHYHEVLRIKPDAHNARYEMGQALERLSRMSEAIEQYDEIVRRNPAHTRAQQRLRQLSTPPQPP